MYILYMQRQSLKNVTCKVENGTLNFSKWYTQNDGQGTLSWKIEIVTEISSHNAEYGT